MDHDRSLLESFEEVDITKKGELALIVFSVGIALILTGFGMLRVLFDVEIGSIVVRAYLALMGMFFVAVGLTVLLKSKV